MELWDRCAGINITSGEGRRMGIQSLVTAVLPPEGDIKVVGLGEERRSTGDPGIPELKESLF